MSDRVNILIKMAKPIIEKYEEIEKSKGEKFNLFSILKMENKEVETHSAFLYELLNPKGSHQQNNLYLQLFIESVLKIDTNQIDFETIKVYRELYVNDYGRIDLAIEDKNQIIVIEIKVDAGDQQNQLKRYNDYLLPIEKYFNKNTKIYYLTKFGKEATEESIAGDKIEYATISFLIDIVHFIDKCIKESAMFPPIRESLKQYLLLVKKITNQKDNNYEKEIIKMINSPEDIKAATQLVDMLPKIWAKKEVEFWDALYEKLDTKMNKHKYEHFIHDKWFDDDAKGEKSIEDRIEITATQRHKAKSTYFGLHYQKKLLTEIDICVDVYQRGDNETIYIQTSLMQDKKNKKLPIAIEKFFEEIGINKKYGNYKYTPIKEKINFYARLDANDKINKDFTYDLFNPIKFNQLLENASKEIIQIIDALMENESKIVQILKK